MGMIINYSNSYVASDVGLFELRVLQLNDK